MRKQLDRIKQARTLGGEANMRRRLEELECKIRGLEEENKRLRMVPEKPYHETVRALKETAQTAKIGASHDWETGKRMEAELARLKGQLTTKTSELSEMKKQLEMTQKALQRATRENELLKERVTQRWGPGALPDSSEDLRVTPAGSNSRIQNPAEITERVALHQQVDALKSEVEKLRRAERISLNLPNDTKIMGAHSMALETAEVRARLATDRVQALERQLLDRGLTTPAKMKIDQAIQEDLLRLNKENLELRFELETVRNDLSGFKTRIRDLQAYVDIMNQEKEALRFGGNVTKSFGSESSGTTNIKKVGESGKTPKELEKIIMRLKNVLQRTLAENERLKCAPGIILQEENQRMKGEIVKLRAELETAQLAVGARLAEYRLVNERSVQRLSQEYENLRRSYEEVVVDHDRTVAELQRARETQTRPPT
ncbi:hypothetical protein EG68_10122 [Paragonimus skrjabini miyazakii]|uniref:Uncharacterized protein n=1 Tax=Paragonimus skrjabini miyazakii TaxID=59628 RepID=A0A8S9YF33_9TREM|nr:hypothetical protein EG68_10122 [Paragonimus skrjabini miyazakii]